MTRPTWSTKGRFIGLRVRNVGGTRERIARSGPISTFDTHIMNILRDIMWYLTEDPMRVYTAEPMQQLLIQES